MTTASRTTASRTTASRTIGLVVACLLGLSSAVPAQAQVPRLAAPPQSTQISGGGHAARGHAPLFASLMDGVIGNRSRMIQFAFIGFAIGVAILMTATRKH